MKRNKIVSFPKDAWKEIVSSHLFRPTDTTKMITIETNDDATNDAFSSAAPPQPAGACTTHNAENVANVLIMPTEAAAHDTTNDVENMGTVLIMPTEATAQDTAHEAANVPIMSTEAQGSAASTTNAVTRHPKLLACPNMM